MCDECNADAAAALLDEFCQHVPSRPERPLTFMEISRYPHYENVCSNILAFFFDPSELHGLGTLFLDALAQVGCIKDPDGTIGVDVQVDREEATSSGNRIDLLIRSHSHAILIENKIFAGTDYNPLEDYAKHLCSLEQPQKCKLFLTLNPVLGESEIGHGFTNITYADFVRELRGLLGKHAARADTRYLTFMLDFLNTLDHLREGRVMSEKLAGFLAKDDNCATATHFFKEIDTFKDELRKTVSELGSNLDDIARDGRVSQGKWREQYGLYDILWIAVEHSMFPDSKIGLNAIIGPTGWSFEIFLQKEPPDPGTLAKLKNLLHKLEIKFEDKYRIPLQKRFGYTDELQKVATFVREVVTKIKQSSDSAT